VLNNYLPLWKNAVGIARNRPAQALKKKKPLGFFGPRGFLVAGYFPFVLVAKANFHSFREYVRVTEGYPLYRIAI
jgi:hypothetical protein